MSWTTEGYPDYMAMKVLSTNFLLREPLFTSKWTIEDWDLEDAGRSKWIKVMGYGLCLKPVEGFDMSLYIISRER
jgi:hypothetical protein